MPLSQAEAELRDRFDASYKRHQTVVMRLIEQAVCGCDYGGTSWATRAEIDDIGAILGLRSGERLLDLGAGSGWPGLYLAGQSGCDVSLVDLPATGLAIAAERAKADRLPGICQVAVADGRALPYADGHFDAISHSDVLCCLPDKLAVAKECRRVISDSGQMVFSVISLAPGLSGDARRQAIENAPPYVTSEIPYDEMARQCGWRITEARDLSAAFLASAKAFQAADQANASELSDLLGRQEFQQRVQKNAEMIKTIGKGQLRRDLYTARAA